MAFLAEPGDPRPPLSTRFVLPFDRADWLLVVGFAAFLATIFLLQGYLATHDRTEFRDRAVCEQRTFLTSGFFLRTHPARALIRMADLARAR